MVTNKNAVFIAADTGRHSMFLYNISFIIQCLKLPQRQRVNIDDLVGHDIDIDKE